jgi:4-amino-4-deoxy-L-arabinose transferase-like glycosyltransferase
VVRQAHQPGRRQKEKEIRVITSKLNGLDIVQTSKTLDPQKISQKLPKSIWVFSLIWLLILSWIAFLNNLGNIGLIDKTEPMFVEAARQMIVTGDWITPYWNGETRFDKPPLSYWMMAIAFKIFGINEWAARIPSALMAIAMIGLGFWTLRKVGFASPSMQNKPDSQRHLWISAWIGTAIMALNFPIIAWARTGVSDMFLAASMTMALFSFFLGYASSENKEIPKGWLVIPDRWYLTFYIFTALAVLAKGPVAIVLETVIIASFCLYLGNFKQILSEIKLLPGSLIFTAIALPWFILVTLANGSEYINVFFGHHNLERFTNVVSSHPGSIYYYVLVILLGFLPWSVYLPIAIARLRFWKREYWRSVPRSTHLGIFCLFWFAVIFVFFSISVTKLPSYVLPLMPAAAILVTLLWSGRMGNLSIDRLFSISEKQSKISQGFLVSAIVNIVILLVLSIASYLSPQLIGKDSAVPYMREALQVSGLPIQSGLVWGIGAIACIVLLARKYHRWLWSANLATFMAFMIFVMPPATALMDAQRQLPIRQLSTLITQVDKPNEDILVVGFIRPSVVFYTQRNVQFSSDINKAIAFIKKNANNKPDTVLILSLPKYPFRMHLTPQDYQLLGKEGAYQLIRVKKEKVLFK